MDFRSRSDKSFFRLQWILLIAAGGVLGSILLAPSFESLAYAQGIETPTATPGGVAPLVTNTYTEPVHVRAGPSSLYPQIGDLAVGDIAQALGVSPQHEWIQIAFQPAAGGVGWVYAPFITVSPGYLRIIEPPPTPGPDITSTIDPTLAAAFSAEPSATRLPTFTPPPPLTIPTYAQAPLALPGFPGGITILAFSAGGVLVLAVSLLRRR